jgi:hypothetical protein
VRVCKKRKPPVRVCKKPKKTESRREEIIC